MSRARSFPRAALIGALGLVLGCPRPDWTPAALRDGSGLASQGAPSPHGAAAAAQPSALEGAADFTRGVKVVLDGGAGATSPVALVLPLAPGRIARLEDLEVLAGAEPMAGIKMRPLLFDYAPGGARRGLRSVLVELPPDPGRRFPLSVEIRFRDPASPPSSARVPPATYSYAATAKKVTVKVPTATWGVESRGASSHAAVPRDATDKELFTSVVPPVRTLYPAGYLAHTKILGDVMPRAELERDGSLAGMRFLSDAFARFGDGAMGRSGYPVHPASVELGVEAWLYDRCATYLLSYAHAGDAHHLEHGLASCASYARQIGLTGDRRGIFEGKKEYRDTKYSHARGLYAYYAVTGDEAAFEAGKAIAEMWDQDALFVVPYRAGVTRGYDKLWTERLLAAGLEGAVYGFLLTGEARFYEGARALVKTSMRHVTTSDAAELRAITKTNFPPQSCFVHNALQQAEGNADVPWCSSWMSELLVDPLLRYQEITGDLATDEIFIRLARSMRDVGTMYFKDNPLGDAFLAPSRPFVKDDEPRLLTPLYGYGVDEAGKRRPSGEWSDFEHCPDAAALTAVALRALRRKNVYDAPPVPASAAFKVDLSRFRSEGESILALFHELAFCAEQALARASRPGRDPRTARPDVLARAFASGDARAQAQVLDAQKIGWPAYPVTPMRKLSWWFNTSIGTFSWLRDAKVPVTDLRPGQIQ